LKLGLVDHPDGGRKTHQRPIPHTGGMAIFLSVVVSAACLAAGSGFEFGRWAVTPLFGLFLGATAVFFIGLLDDVRRLGPGIRLFAEISISSALIYAGVRFPMPGAGSGGVGILPQSLLFLVSVAWLVGVTNAFNLLDGSDGVAGGTALAALLGMGSMAFLLGNPPVALSCATLAGATLGFLVFNFPPATIFMGDSGSLFLGLVLAGLGLLLTRSTRANVGISVPTLAVGVAILDTGLAVTRRFLSRKAIMRGDRGHIHHRLRDLGFSPREVAVLLFALTVTFSLLGLLLLVDLRWATLSAVALIGIITVRFVRDLEIPEFLEVGRILGRGLHQRVAIERNLKLREGADLLFRAQTMEEGLDALCHAFSRGDFTALEVWFSNPLGRVPLMVPGATEHGPGGQLLLDLSQGEADEAPSWKVILPFGGEGGPIVGRLSLFRRSDPQPLKTDMTVVTLVFLPALEDWARRCASMVAEGSPFAWDQVRERMSQRYLPAPGSKQQQSAGSPSAAA